MSISYKIRSAHLIWSLSSADVGNLNDIPDGLKKQYGQNDWQVMVVGTKDPMVNPYNPSLGTDFYRIHPTDPDIRELAVKLQGNEKNVYRILDNFYEFLDRGDGNTTHSGGEGCAYPDQFQMGQSRQTWGGLPKPARATLDDWVGDCDDQSFLFISMCRAVGIPARVEAGALWDSGVGAWGGHGWAQVYLPIKDGEDAWVNFDIVNNQFMERDPYRFTDYIGSGVPGELEDYYTSWTYRSSGGGNVIIEEAYTDVGHRAIPGEDIVHV
jgi:transglutaminase-like putative cysteine protease